VEQVAELLRHDAVHLEGHGLADGGAAVVLGLEALLLLLFGFQV
jgi:hypothetical protein